MRSVNLKGKKRKSETNGSEGDLEENGGTVSSNATDTSCVDEVKESDNNNMTRAKKRARLSKSEKSNGKLTEDENKNDNVDNDENVSTTSDEHENGDVKNNKRRKKETNNKPTTSHDDDDDDDDDVGADNADKTDDADNADNADNADDANDAANADDAADADDADASKENNNDDDEEQEEEEEEKKEKEKPTEESDAEEYEVEKIVDVRTIKGKRQFLVRWKGYSEDSDTWEKEKDLSCPLLIEEYLEQENKKENIESKKKITLSKIKKTKKKKITKGKKKTVKQTTKSSKNGKNIKDKNNDDDVDEKEEKNNKKEYEVEKILDVHFKKNKEKEFLIRWKGFSSKDDTWEPEKNLNCSKLIDGFMNKLEKTKLVDPRELRTNPKHTKRYTLTTKDTGRRLSRRNVNKQRTTYYQCDE